MKTAPGPFRPWTYPGFLRVYPSPSIRASTHNGRRWDPGMMNLGSVSFLTRKSAPPLSSGSRRDGGATEIPPKLASNPRITTAVSLGRPVAMASNARASCTRSKFTHGVTY